MENKHIKWEELFSLPRFFCRLIITTLTVALLIALCSTPTLTISSDGRLHTCGVVTEQGVTENLDAYAARCGASK